MDTINLNNYESYFIRWIENDLSAAEIQEVKDFLLIHKELNIELEWFKKTILVPDNTVEFPFKNNLYKSENKTNTAVLFKLNNAKYAIAAILITGAIGLLYFLMPKENDNLSATKITKKIIDTNIIKSYNEIASTENNTTSTIKLDTLMEHKTQNQNSNIVIANSRNNYGTKAKTLINNTIQENNLVQNHKENNELKNQEKINIQKKLIDSVAFVHIIKPSKIDTESIPMAHNENHNNKALTQTQENYINNIETKSTIASLPMAVKDKPKAWLKLAGWVSDKLSGEKNNKNENFKLQVGLLSFEHIIAKN